MDYDVLIVLNQQIYNFDRQNPTPSPDRRSPLLTRESNDAINDVINGVGVPCAYTGLHSSPTLLVTRVNPTSKEDSEDRYGGDGVKSRLFFTHHRLTISLKVGCVRIVTSLVLSGMSPLFLLYEISYTRSLCSELVLFWTKRNPQEGHGT